MWKLNKTRTESWSLVISNASSARSRTEKLKEAHELRILNLLLLQFLPAQPERVTKRESPDFQVLTATGPLFVEVVEAIPDAVTADSTTNVARLRSDVRRWNHVNTPLYHVEVPQFGAAIARVIKDKRGKARQWLSDDQELCGRPLVLLISGGQAPLRLRDYFPDAVTLQKHVAVATIDPFAAVVFGDETGAFVATST